VLHDGVRQDDTPMHKALREALVNALVHADYTDRASVKIVKRPDGFLFRNPGLMRVPPAAALMGGESDCRNRTLHQMFLNVGFGERAGSGLPRIKKDWPGEIRLSDGMEPYDQSRLEMLLPKELPEGRDVEKGVEKSSYESSYESSQKTDGKILALLSQNPALSAKQLGERLHISSRAVQKQLASLKGQGRLRRIGPDKGGHWEVL
jgi:ATP-dependent DNA helicase RecG